MKTYMKNVALLAVAVGAFAALSGCMMKSEAAPAPVNAQARQSEKGDESKEVARLVEAFGKKLQLVSLLAPKDVVSKSMKENYGSFVTEPLLARWQKDPQHAPGRRISSPWPDRIAISAVEKLSKDAYRVTGEIIEITSVEQKEGGAAAKQPIVLKVIRSGNRWLIDDVTLGAEQSADSLVYVNRQYGFKFPLPETWKGYKIVTSQWKGMAPGGAQGEQPVATGPLISIRHPQWTSENPRQDIPILVLTLHQWKDLQAGKFHIGAAPINPKELGRNSKYVFALPARYNFAFLKGYEEVEKILEQNPLQPVEPNRS